MIVTNENEPYQSQRFALEMYFIFMFVILVLAFLSSLLFFAYFSSFENRFSAFNPNLHLSFSVIITIPVIVSFICFIFYLGPFFSYFFGLSKSNDGLIDFKSIMNEQSNPSSKKSKIRNILLASLLFLLIFSIIVEYIYFLVGIFILIS